MAWLDVISIEGRMTVTGMGTGMGMAVFAHSLRDQPVDRWEPLSSHLSAVGARAAEFAEVFGWAQAASVAGRLHDIGKCSAAFQDYIRRGRGDAERTRGPDHSTAGARVAAETYPGPLGRMLAYAIAGHHAGLCDFGSLEERLDEDHSNCSCGWSR
jgi:CRISPR-associated endonuclease/helicase Cas3